MGTKFSEDIIPLSDLKVNPGKIVKRVAATHRPVLLTSRGRGVAVLQSLQDFEAAAEETFFVKGVVQGLIDMQEGREETLSDLKLRLGIG